MATPAETAALLAGALLVLLALVSVRATARFAAQAPGVPAAWRPRCTVIVPCRGEHQGFADNVRALAAQDYPDHELRFVVDRADDPAAAALRALQAEVPRIQVLLAEPEGAGKGGASGKIVAMLTGAARADPASEVLVFADADARPPPGWLASLVGPLEDPAIGATTGFPWYVAATRPTLATALRDAWVANVLDGMAWARYRSLWGGSMAVRRADFARSPVRQEWGKAIADDAGLANAVKALGLRLAFAPGAMVLTAEDAGARDVGTWMMREYALTRFAKPAGFRALLLLHLVHVTAQAAGVALLLLRPSPLLALAGGLLVAPSLLEVLRAVVRARLPLMALPAARGRPLAERAMQRAWAAFLPWAIVVALLRAARLKELRWRGRTYRLGEAR